MIRLVKQEHVYGCGLACVAMVSNTTYKSVRFEYDEIFGEPEWVFSKKRKRHCLDYGTSAGDLSDLMKIYGVQSSRRLLHFKSWDSLSDIAIISVYHKSVEDNTSWHWVVFDRKQNVVLDPWPHYKKLPMIRTDYKRLRPQFYVGVYP